MFYGAKICFFLESTKYFSDYLHSAFAFSAKLQKIAYDGFLAYWAGNKPALPALLAE